jgi:hypothetical protein
MNPTVRIDPGNFATQKELSIPMKTAATVILLAFLTPAAMAQPTAAESALSLQQQLDLAKASVDRTLTNMTELILRQEDINAKLAAELASVKKAAPENPPKPMMGHPAPLPEKKP